MSIRVQCEKCQSTHSLNQRLLGRSIRCPVCDATIDDRADLPSAREEKELVDVELVSKSSEEFTDVELVESEQTVSDTISVGQEGIYDDAQTDLRGSDSDGPPHEVEEMEDEDGLVFPKRQLLKDDMDMTPMVDVTFLLLIFFMITASFTSEKVLEEPPPLSDSSTNAKEEPDKIQDTVRVQVDEFNAYTIILPGGEDRQASSKQDLIIALEDARKELVTGVNDNALKMAVEAHTESIHAAVVAAVDAAREKGFSSIQVTVVEEFD